MIDPAALRRTPGKNIAADLSASRAYTIALASGESGAGKRSICINLGIALTLRGRKVCVFETGGSDGSGMNHLLRPEASVDELLATAPGGVQVLAAGSGMGEFIHLRAEQQQRLLEIMRLLEQRFDYLLLDTQAGINDTLVQFLLAAPYTILTITPEPSSLTNAFSLLKILKRYYFNHPLYVVVNRVSNLPEAHDTFKWLKQCAVRFLQLEIRYLGYALSDEEIEQPLHEEQSLLLQQPRTMFSQCLSAIANRLQQLLEQRPPGDSFSDFFEGLCLPPAADVCRNQPSLSASGSSGNENATPPGSDSVTATPQASPVPRPSDERDALLAATYYAHLLGTKEAMNG